MCSSPRPEQNYVKHTHTLANRLAAAVNLAHRRLAAQSTFDIVMVPPSPAVRPINQSVHQSLITTESKKYFCCFIGVMALTTSLEVGRFLYLIFAVFV